MKKITALIVVLSIICSMVVSFAAAEPKTNVDIANYTDSLNWKVSYAASQTSRSYVDFKTIDTTDKEHGEVVKYY